MAVSPNSEENIWDHVLILNFFGGETTRDHFSSYQGGESSFWNLSPGNSVRDAAPDLSFVFRACPVCVPRARHAVAPQTELTQHGRLTTDGRDKPVISSVRTDAASHTKAKKTPCASLRRLWENVFFFIPNSRQNTYPFSLSHTHTTCSVTLQSSFA